MEQEHELVLCIHGLGRTRHCWWLLRKRLEQAGYHTQAWTYPGFRRSIEDLGHDCRRRLEVYANDPDVRRLHIVTHSLGGIIARQALQEVGVSHAMCGNRVESEGQDARTGSVRGQTRPSRLGTLIMLAPPNRGSVWARRLGPWLGWLALALPQLSDAPGSFVNGLGPVPGGLRVAVIAAARDGKCPVSTTHWPGQSAHVVVPGRHTLIMYRRDVAEAVIGLLANQQQFNER